MIQCETCKVWQHCPCVGLGDGQVTPDKYYCESCRPQNHPYKVLNGVFNNSKRGHAAPAVPPPSLKAKPTKKRNTMNSKEASTPMDFILAQQKWSEGDPLDAIESNTHSNRASKRRRKTESTTDDDDDAKAADDNTANGIKRESDDTHSNAHGATSSSSPSSSPKSTSNGAFKSVQSAKHKKSSSSSNSINSNSNNNSSNHNHNGSSKSAAVHSRSSSPVTPNGFSHADTHLHSDAKADDSSSQSASTKNVRSASDAASSSQDADGIVPLAKRRKTKPDAQGRSETATEDPLSDVPSEKFKKDTNGDSADTPNSSRSRKNGFSRTGSNRRLQIGSDAEDNDDTSSPTDSQAGQTGSPGSSSTAMGSGRKSGASNHGHGHGHGSKKSTRRTTEARTSSRHNGNNSRHSTPQPHDRGGTPQPWPPVTPAVVRYPSPKMSIQEMTKRAKQLLDYITRMQVDMANEKNRSGCSSPASTPPKNGVIALSTITTIGTPSAHPLSPPLPLVQHAVQHHSGDSQVPDLTRTSMDSTSDSHMGDAEVKSSDVKSEGDHNSYSAAISSSVETLTSSKDSAAVISTLTPAADNIILSAANNDGTLHGTMSAETSPQQSNGALSSVKMDDVPRDKWTSFELMDKLTGDLIRFQEKFGAHLAPLVMGNHPSGDDYVVDGKEVFQSYRIPQKAYKKKNASDSKEGVAGNDQKPKSSKSSSISSSSTHQPTFHHFTRSQRLAFQQFQQQQNLLQQQQQTQALFRGRDRPNGDNDTDGSSVEGPYAIPVPRQATLESTTSLQASSAGSNGGTARAGGNESTTLSSPSNHVYWMDQQGDEESASEYDFNAMPAMGVSLTGTRLGRATFIDGEMHSGYLGHQLTIQEFLSVQQQQQQQFLEHQHREYQKMVMMQQRQQMILQQKLLQQQEYQPSSTVSPPKLFSYAERGSSLPPPPTNNTPSTSPRAQRPARNPERLHSSPVLPASNIGKHPSTSDMLRNNAHSGTTATLSTVHHMTPTSPLQQQQQHQQQQQQQSTPQSPRPPHYSGQPNHDHHHHNSHTYSIASSHGSSNNGYLGTSPLHQNMLAMTAAESGTSPPSSSSSSLSLSTMLPAMNVNGAVSSSTAATTAPATAAVAPTSTNASRMLLPSRDSPDLFETMPSSSPIKLDELVARVAQSHFPQSGREYHPDRTIPYLLPCDEQECERLILQHHVLRYALGSNVIPPIDTTLAGKVLDCGCGPGTWVMEMAAEYKNLEFYGFDISPMYPASSTVLPLAQQQPQPTPNTHFSYGNLLANEIPFPADTFVLVHQRNLLLGLPQEAWPAVLADLFRTVLPGGQGYLQLCEVDPNWSRTGPHTTALLQRRLQQTAELHRIDLLVPRHLDSLLTHVGCVNVQMMMVEIPIGRWGDSGGGSSSSSSHSGAGGQLGWLWQQVLRAEMAALQPIVVQAALEAEIAGGADRAVVGAEMTTPEEWDHMMEAVWEEMDQYRTFSRVYVAYGQKP
ncbi:hypothetical protein DFQ26_005854 [Actinomortierella ambigua]|nr:hypothetical protein DFQ26_005854 [Actinomortierella ambigua]